MIWSDIHFYSETLQIQTAAYVLLPEADVLQARGGKPLPALYLLHGLSDDHTAWLRNSLIARYARQYAVAVIMPAVNRSFYTDMAHGAKYWTFISEELPRVMEAIFPLMKTRDGRFAAGLSMGGYGAMKLGLRCPERYAAVAALSAPLMLHQMADAAPSQPNELMREMMDIFGSVAEMKLGDGNLEQAAARLKAEEAPAMLVACGTQDFLFEANQAFYAMFGQKFGIHYLTQAGADHTWDFWNAYIDKVLQWLPLERLENVW